MTSRQGVLTCLLAAAVGACASAETVPDATPDCIATDEICNAVDDDCDEGVDEGFDDLGAACTSGQGACAVTGGQVCGVDGQSVECDAEAGLGGTETCNGIDDDCDATTDEGFGLGDPCDGPDADLCGEGTMICDASANPVCSDVSGDSVETCNSADDDCDDQTDEDLGLGDDCDGGDGDQCTEGNLVCDGIGGVTCDDTTGTTVESCNGIDDDCVGGADNGYGVGGPCSNGVGGCSRPGQDVCNGAGTGVQCNAVAGSPTAEYCGDGTDQDCNGSDVSCPINDGPGGAINISAGGTFSVEMVAANDHRRNSCSFGSAGGRDVYYSLTLGAPEVVYLDTFGSNFDSTIAILTGGCSTATVETACVDDGCTVGPTQMAVSLAAGTYCVVVDQYYGTATTGALVLNVVRGGRTGTAITAASGSRTGNTCSPTTSQTTAGCQSNSGAGDVGYYFLTCPSAPRTVGANTCTNTTWDSVAYLRRGSAQSADVACSDDNGGCAGALQSQFTGAVINTAGLNWLIVDGYAANCGAYTLTYTIQ